jgi:hypothetical protein
LISVKLNTAFPVMAVLEDGRSSRFVQGKLYNNAGVLLSTFNVPIVSDGLYIKSDLMATIEGIFYIRYQVFIDAEFSTPSNQYAIVTDTIRVENMEENLTETTDRGDGRIA